MAQVTHDQERNRLTIRADGWAEGNLLMLLPSRRWLPTKGVFQVPLTRQNCVALLEGTDQLAISLSEVIRNLLGSIAYPVQISRQWPNDFPFRVQPFPDQLTALQRLYAAGNCGAMFMRPGSGKSFVYINLAAQFWLEELIDVAVVVCPLTVTTVWYGDIGQITQYSPVPTEQHLWPADDITLNHKRLVWVMVGVESLSQGGTFDDLTAMLEGIKYGMLVDESTRIKHHNKIRTERVIALGEQATTRHIATGTPADKLLDLYSQFQFVDPNVIGIGDYYAFRNRYCEMGGFKRKQVVGYNHTDELMGLIAPVTFRCDKPKGLPKKLPDRRDIDMSPEQKAKYNAVKNAEIPEVSVASILQSLAKRQQVVGGFLMDDPKEEVDPLTGRKKRTSSKVIWQLPPDKNPKVQTLMQWLEEMSDAEQVVIWARHLWEIDSLVAVLGQANCRMIVGSTPFEERAGIIEDFQQKRYRFFLGTQMAGGIGITLHSSHYCVYYSNTFSFEDRMQSEDRLHRIGQKNEVLYLDLWMRRSVDQLLERALLAKMDLDQFIADQLDKAGASGIKQLLAEY